VNDEKRTHRRLEQQAEYERREAERRANVALNATESLIENIYESYFDEDEEVVGPSRITGNEEDGYSFTMIEHGRVIKVTHQDVTGQVKHVSAYVDDDDSAI
jgi:hypothetical protein